MGTAGPAAPATPDRVAASPASDSPAGERPEQAAPAPEYSTPLLDAPTLAGVIRASCDSALAEKRPVLLEFSASWCSDCIALERLKRAPALATELSHWQLLAINVGSGEEHPELMRAFQVRAIAKLVVVTPSNCATPISSWPRGATRTLDGLGKRAEDADGELAGWLASARRRLPHHR